MDRLINEETKTFMTVDEGKVMYCLGSYYKVNDERFVNEYRINTLCTKEMVQREGFGREMLKHMEEEIMKDLNEEVNITVLVKEHKFICDGYKIVDKFKIEDEKYFMFKKVLKRF